MNWAAWCCRRRDDCVITNRGTVYVFVQQIAELAGSARVTGFAGIADLLGVLEHFKFALNVAFFVRHEYFLHPKSGDLQEVSRESVHIYTFDYES